MRSRIASSEVKAERRRFTNKYKLKILAEAEKCTESGELGALLRREGLYDSHLWRWRKAQREGRLGAGVKQARVPSSTKALERKVAELTAKNARLEKALEQAELVIDVQKKLSMLLGLEMSKGNGQS
jgi:transposase-like protein